MIASAGVQPVDTCKRSLPALQDRRRNCSFCEAAQMVFAMCPEGYQRVWVNSVNPAKPRGAASRENLQDCLALNKSMVRYKTHEGSGGSTKVSCSLWGAVTAAHCRAGSHLRALLCAAVPQFIFHFLPFVLSENQGAQRLPIVSLCLFKTWLWLGLGSCCWLPVNSRAPGGFHKTRLCLFR